MTLKAPFPYFGGKSRAVDIVWPRFGAVRNYVEPFFGSGAMLLGRPAPWIGSETVNDADGMLCNFWRALCANPKLVAKHANWPVNENDLHARHAWLVGRRDSLQARLEGDPRYYDAQIAGWWVWGMACWIGGEFCSGKGPWQRARNSAGEWVLTKGEEFVPGVQRSIVHLGVGGKGVTATGVKRSRVDLGGKGITATGVKRNRVHLGTAGCGVNTLGVSRSLVCLGNSGRGIAAPSVQRRRVHLGSGSGVKRKLVELGSDRGVSRRSVNLLGWFEDLASRLARVRVCCGDWSRVCGPSPTTLQGLTAVFLDPPYADTARRDPNLYRVDSASVAHDVREWAIAHGDDPLMRIALCGYAGEHKLPRGWTCVVSKATNQGYSSQKRSRGGHSVNAHRERIWFSPHCLRVKTAGASAVSAPARKAVCHG